MSTVTENFVSHFCKIIFTFKVTHNCAVGKYLLLEFGLRM
jgi:hypothetical protein